MDVLDVDRLKYPSQAKALLDSGVLYVVPEIKISPASSLIILESLLQVVGQGETPQLKKMTLDISLHYIDPTLVFRAALTVQEFVITGGLRAQLQAILTGIQDCTNAGLKSLTVESDSLDLVSPDVLAGAAVKLERLVVRSRLSYDQLQAILARVAATRDPRLRNVQNTQQAYLSGMDPLVVAESLVKLDAVGYTGLRAKLSDDQVLPLFTRISEAPDLRLKRLHFNYEVPASSASSERAFSAGTRVQSFIGK